MFFNLNNEDESIEKTIYYDYYNTPVYLNQCEKNTLLNGFIKMPFVNSNSVKNPNLRTNKNNYKISKIYLFKNIHHINNISYDGELIIEHIPITNSVDKIFTVFMLKTGNVSATILDNIIENAGAKEDIINLNLNEIIIQTNNAKTPLNCMNINNVFVFSNPIIVKSTFDQFKKLTKNDIDFLFSENGVYKLNITAIFQKEYIENFQEGNIDKTDIENALKDTKVTISCTPINTNDIDENVSFVPITSEMSKGYGMVTSLITIIIVFIFMLYPVLEINKNIKQNLTKFEYYLFYMCIIIINILLSVILFNGNDSISYIFGIIIVSLTFVSITLVYFYNQFNDMNYSNKTSFKLTTLTGCGLIVFFIITLVLFYVPIWSGAFGKYTDIRVSNLPAILFVITFVFTLFVYLLIRLFDN
jgi:hypothetical protein